MTVEAKISVPDRNGYDRLGEERAALRAALESQVFQARPRLAVLLRYLCERYFEGQIEGIKEYSIATEVFHRPDSFDQATDSIVRVEVFRLRKRLREFYEGEGAGQPIEIVIATGHYRPEFIDRVLGAGPAGFRGVVDISDDETLAPVSDADGHSASAGPMQQPVTFARARRRIGAWLAWSAVAMMGVAIVAAWWLGRSHQRAGRNESPLAAEAVTAAPAGPEVHIRCGYSRPMFKDDEGTLWSGDRYFSGGFNVELPKQHIARTRDPELYLTARTGVFSYKIPLAPGTYELRLHFAETTYSPASTLGGGENSRVFDVRLNGRLLLSQFDIASDAGTNAADIRVFRDIAPDKDGFLRLDFSAVLSLPMINAIEIVPGLPHRLRPIRMVAQDSFFVDRAGDLWMPDSYFSGGRLAADKVAVDGTDEPGLYGGERYGNFTYALPVDDGTYKMTLYFSEKYWGVGAAQDHPAGRRVFDIFCNGAALARGLDIAREAGPGRALVKVFHGLRGNAQGKLVVWFVPEVNYASVDAVEVEQERP